MKNIHVLPTDKPSRLYFDVVIKELFLQRKLNIEATSFPIEKRNIYITNDEEIKEGDYYIDFTSNGIKIEHFKTKDDWVLVGICDSKKIILTTDQDLIADGVQKIPDEFLDWFVKNSSCEFVEIDNRLKISSTQKGFVMDNPNYKKIIIPKEESKQEIQLKDPNTCEHFKELGCIKDICTCYTLVSKQETLDEVAEKESEYLADWEDKDMYKKGFIDGAKWQQQQNKNLYSEEDLEQAHFDGKLKKQSFKEWFNQFKKQ